MGNFDTNCCLTGLPIKRKDSIRIGVVTGKMDNQTIVSPADMYQFVIPPVNAIYNEGGSADWEDIEEKSIVELFFKMLLPGLEAHEPYPYEPFKSTPKNEIQPKEFWENLRNVCFDPNREYRQNHKKWIQEGRTGEEPRFWREDKYPVLGEDVRPLNIWMCHTWAWNNLVNMYDNSKHEVLKEQIENTFFTHRRIREEMLGKPRENLWSKTLEYRCRENTFIFGKDGVFSTDLEFLIHELEIIGLHDEFEKIEEQFRHIFVETIYAVINMRHIRKHLFPATNVGEQHEEFFHLEKWLKDISDKATEAREFYQEQVK